MFNNIGGKIKGLAKFIFALEAIAGVVTGLVFILLDEDLALLGIPIMIGVPILAWVSSFLLYGFGEIIVKLTEIEINTRGEGNCAVQKKVDAERIKKITSLRDRGVITEAEYLQAISKEYGNEQ